MSERKWEEIEAKIRNKELRDEWRNMCNVCVASPHLLR
jgi:hypothetical protein